MSEMLIKRNGKFSEDEVRNFVRQCLTGISHLHANNVVHRDLKLENLLCDEDNNHRIILIDFGLARKKRDKDSTFDDGCGTMEYIAPEVLQY